MYKKVLVTGGSGFLGRRIVQECKNYGYEVLSPRSAEVNLYDCENLLKIISQKL